MDRVNFLETKINEAMEVYLKDLRQPNNDHLVFQAVADTHGKHYQIIALGWEGYERIFNLLFHLDIVGDKIWVQEDKMEDSIAELLVEKGVSKKDIVIGYFPDYHRVHTEYAVN